MNRLILIAIVFILLSCKEKKERKIINDAKQSVKSSGLSRELYNKLIEYQHFYPIQKVARTDLLKVYEAYFTKAGKDTVLIISLHSDGVYALDNQILYGVYKDDNLAPTVIVDTKDFYSKNFVDSVVNDSNALNQLKPVKGESYPESFPPVYYFKVKGKYLMLTKIDTVWTRW